MLGIVSLAILYVTTGAVDPIVALRQSEELCADIRAEAGQRPLHEESVDHESYRVILGDHYSYRWWTYTAVLDPSGGVLTVNEWIGGVPGREARVSLTEEDADRIRRAAHENGFWLGMSDEPPEGFRVMMRTVLIEGAREGQARCSTALAAIDLRAFDPLTRELLDRGAVYEDLAEVEYENSPKKRCLQAARIRGTPESRDYQTGQFVWVFSGRFLESLPEPSPRSSRRVETPEGPRIEDTWVIQEKGGKREICFWRPVDP